jgi:uncharacterized membrane protein YeaQ/YmgE (transglycosylase-associated protein family)
MHDMNWIVIIVAGIFAGWVAERVMNRSHGILTNLVVGLVGAFIGSWLAGVLGIAYSGLLPSILIAVGGAVVLLFVLGLFKRR